MQEKPATISSKRRLCIIIAAIMLVFAALAIYDMAIDPQNYWNFHGFYLNDSGYAKALGVSELTYEAFLAQYGAPMQTEKQFDAQGRQIGFISQYSGFSLECVFWDWVKNPARRNVPHLIMITITDSGYQFGWLRIGVGSAKERVHLAYMLDKKFSQEKILAEGYHSEEAYCADGWRWILFDYDENGRVEKMQITYRIM